MNRLFQLYKLVLLAHIQSKTTCPLFHEKSQEFYELLFSVFHEISEKNQDTGEDKPGDEAELAKETYDALEEAKTIIEGMINEKPSIGTDNLLRGLYDKLEFACGNAKGFLKEEEEEVEIENEELPTKRLLR